MTARKKKEKAQPAFHALTSLDKGVDAELERERIKRIREANSEIVLLPAVADPYGLEDDTAPAREEPPRAPAIGDMVTTLGAAKWCMPPRRIEKIDGDRIEVRDARGETEELNGYGLALAQWLFADDPRAFFASDADLQLLSVKRRGINPILALALDMESDVPKCSVCGCWPCRKLRGSCPDYERILKEGRHWLRDEHRLETPEEAFKRFIIPI